MKRILLACAAGMSTSMLVQKMEKAASEKGIDAEISAVPADSVSDIIAKDPVDIILLGPQVRYMESQFKEKYETNSTAVGVINMMDYGQMNGEKVLNSALELIG